MLTFKKRLTTIIFLAFLSAATLVSCGKQGNKEQTTDEHPADSTEHPADSAKHEHPSEHPADSTKK